MLRGCHDHFNDPFHIGSHYLRINQFMVSVCVIVPCTEIYSCRFQMWRQDGDIAERTDCFLKTEAMNELSECPVVAAIVHSVVITFAVKFNDLVYIRSDTALGERFGTVTAGFFIFAE